MRRRAWDAPAGHNFKGAHRRRRRQVAEQRRPPRAAPRGRREARLRRARAQVRQRPGRGHPPRRAWPSHFDTPCTPRPSTSRPSSPPRPRPRSRPPPPAAPLPASPTAARTGAPATLFVPRARRAIPTPWRVPRPLRPPKAPASTAAGLLSRPGPLGAPPSPGGAVLPAPRPRRHPTTAPAAHGPVALMRRGRARAGLARWGTLKGSPKPPLLASLLGGPMAILVASSLAVSARADETTVGRRAAPDAHEKDQPHTSVPRGTPGSSPSSPPRSSAPQSVGLADDDAPTASTTSPRACRTFTASGPFGVGAGIQWAARPSRSDAANGDSTIGRLALAELLPRRGPRLRYYFLRSRSWDFWAEVTAGLVVLNDSWTTNADNMPYEQTSKIGPEANTLGTEGFTPGPRRGRRVELLTELVRSAPCSGTRAWFLPTPSPQMTPTLGRRLPRRPGQRHRRRRPHHLPHQPVAGRGVPEAGWRRHGSSALPMWRNMRGVMRRQCGYGPPARAVPRETGLAGRRHPKC